MADVDIGRLSVEVPGLSPDAGRRLGAMIAQRLADTRWTPPKSADNAKIAVGAPANGADLETLAGLIVAELKRQMA